MATLSMHAIGPSSQSTWSQSPVSPRMPNRSMSNDSTDGMSTFSDSMSSLRTATTSARSPSTDAFSMTSYTSMGTKKSRAHGHSNSILSASSKDTKATSAKTKKPSIFGFLALKEPSTSALQEYADQQKKLAAAKGGRVTAVGLPGVSSQKLPQSVPKVNSKWDGLPKPLNDKNTARQCGSRPRDSSASTCKTSADDGWSRTGSSGGSFSTTGSPSLRGPLPSPMSASFFGVERTVSADRPGTVKKDANESGKLLSPRPETQWSLGTYHPSPPVSPFQCDFPDSEKTQPKSVSPVVGPTTDDVLESHKVVMLALEAMDGEQKMTIDAPVATPAINVQHGADKQQAQPEIQQQAPRVDEKFCDTDMGKELVPGPAYALPALTMTGTAPTTNSQSSPGVSPLTPTLHNTLQPSGDSRDAPSFHSTASSRPPAPAPRPISTYSRLAARRNFSKPFVPVFEAPTEPALHSMISEAPTGRCNWDPVSPKVMQSNAQSDLSAISDLSQKTIQEEQIQKPVETAEQCDQNKTWSEVYRLSEMSFHTNDLAAEFAKSPMRHSVVIEVPADMEDAAAENKKSCDDIFGVPAAQATLAGPFDFSDVPWGGSVRF